jgi:multidrug efflux pump subunit AcrA (membrane-fusion protein)
MGFVGGAAAHLNKARIGDDFIVDVAKVLSPNRAAVVAEIEEEFNAPVDTRMEALGGIIFRRTLSEVEHTIHDENLAVIKADLAQTTAEDAQADADRQAKRQERIKELESKLQAWLEEDRERRQAAKCEAQAKALILKAKAAVAKARAAETHI